MSRILQKKQEKKKRRPSEVPTVIICLLTALLLFVNAMIVEYSYVISMFFGETKFDENTVTAATKKAQDLTVQMEEEGIVLLRNENNILPLDVEKQPAINVFGYSSQYLVYGGSGSGAGEEDNNISLTEGLQQAGFSVNEELQAFYESATKEREEQNIHNLVGADFNIMEIPVSDYSEELIDNAVAYSDTALIVIGRIGGENGDMPLDMSGYYQGDDGKHYLELQDVEMDLIEMVKEHFKKIVLLVNSSYPLELEFAEDGIDGVLCIGGPGSTGCIAVGEVLAGTVNPSGRTVDIWAYDNTSAPSYYNIGDFTYTGTDYKFMDYAEGIYIGYRYYETAAADGFIDYDSVVQYPFGYGLSYTDFEWQMGELQESGDKETLSVDVTVTNTGDKPGKDVVELYASAPWKKGDLEKAEVSLCAYGKTKELDPGESETLTLNFAVRDMASYDYTGAQAYVLDKGIYEIRLQRNSHEVADTREYTVENTVLYDTDDVTGTKITNLFDDISTGEDENITWLSRSDWEGTFPKEKAQDRELSATLQEELAVYESDDYPLTVMPDNPEDAAITTGAKNGLTLTEMKGLAYDDPLWESLLDQLSVKDMLKLVGYGGYSSAKIKSVGKNFTIEIDGPSALNSLINSQLAGNQYTAMVVLASTWNDAVAEEFGRAYGEEALAYEVAGLYSPAVNIHRSPFSGRNYEYFSEDPLISGKMGAGIVRGRNEKGVYSYVKHFALNDQETNRKGVCTWATEQSMREIYLKAFEITVKEGEATGIMSAYNRLGIAWAGSSYALQTSLLRDEWGFRGTIITDGLYHNNAIMDAIQSAAGVVTDNGYRNTRAMLRAGGDLLLDSVGTDLKGAYVTDSNTGLQQLRRASHNILYTNANSAATEQDHDRKPYWAILLVLLDGVYAALIVRYFVRHIRKVKEYKVYKKENE